MESWIGLSKPEGTGVCSRNGPDCRANWTWTDGTSYYGYNNWNQLEPHNGEECVAISEAFGWRGWNCKTTRKTYVCEKGML
jgi:hypothetical protein